MKIKINITEGHGCGGCGKCDACMAAAPYPAERHMDTSDCEKSDYKNAHNGEEARMHRTTLAHLMADVKVLLDLIEDGDDLPEWLETKITKAGDYMSSAARYIAGNVARDHGHLEEGVKKKFSEGLIYHLENNIPVNQNIFRPGSEQFFRLFKEVRSLHNQGMYELEESEEFYILETTELGEWGIYEGERVPLEYPFLYEEEEIDEAKYKGREVKLGKAGAKRSGDGRAYVFVRDKKTGKIRKVSFGSSMPDAMGSSAAAKKRRKNFGDRHNCADKKDNTKPGYWSCRATKMFGRNIPGWW